MLDLNSIEYLQTVEGLEALYGDAAPASLRKDCGSDHAEILAVDIIVPLLCFDNGGPCGNRWQPG